MLAVSLQQLILHHHHSHAALQAISVQHVTSAAAAVEVVQAQALGHTPDDMFDPSVVLGHRPVD